MQNHLARDLTDADRQKAAVLRTREHILLINQGGEGGAHDNTLKMKCMQNMDRIADHKDRVQNTDSELMQGLADDVKDGAD